jgi:hypothetical protein
MGMGVLRNSVTGGVRPLRRVAHLSRKVVSVDEYTFTLLHCSTRLIPHTVIFLQLSNTYNLNTYANMTVFLETNSTSRRYPACQTCPTLTITVRNQPNASNGSAIAEHPSVFAARNFLLRMRTPRYNSTSVRYTNVVASFLTLRLQSQS